MSWTGFLPTRAIIMAARRRPSADVDGKLPSSAPELSRQEARTIVFGEGDPQADLLFVGDVTGQQGPPLGRPFAGPAGVLLDRMIQAMGLTREQVYVACVSRSESANVADSGGFLDRELDTIRPKVVVALGEFAARALLQSEEPISALRGRIFPFRDGIRLMPTWHPEELLRTPDFKRQAWEDLQAVQRELGLKK